jgi:alcohol dehydrogenase class IV
MQNIVIYPGAIIELQTTLAQLKKQKVFLVTGKKSFESCGAKEKLQWLLNSYEVTHFCDFQTNPDSQDLIKGLELFNNSKCDIIVSIGGGSVIDMAKLINYFYNTGIKKIEESSISNEDFKPVAHICLPTTAGSGAESTQFAVLYIDNTKFSIAHAKLAPNYVIIDSELHYNQTVYQKAVSGLDALGQAIESFWSVQSTPESRLYSEKALELVWNNLPNSVHNSDKISHLKLAVGANMAGQAINVAKTTAPHALSYGFTKKIGLAHGHAVALTLAQFFEFNFKNVDITSTLFETRKKIFQIINCDNIYDGKTRIENFIIELDLETKLSKLSFLDRTELSSFTADVNIQRLSNNPKSVSKSDINNIINRVY